ncbi:DUF6468 domain-containing protein [Pannonibacter phragmitetus]|uniref:DUF6468 domain-containing protein n=1 Tax=Pannonibacter phragmitetus TaxID=121719 RepID=UPI003D2F389A
MTSLPLGMLIEALVAVLLLVTIGYCWILNRRLQRLRADEETLRATISELITATEIAERAILGLKATANDADKTLGTRLTQAEHLSKLLAGQLGEGEAVLTRISQIAEAARTAHAAEDARRASEEEARHRAQAQAQAQAEAEARRMAAAQQAAAPAYQPAPQGYVAPQAAPRQAAPSSYAAPYRQQAPSYAPAPAAPAAAPSVSARDIRAAAAEATARLERFRKKSGRLLLEPSPASSCRHCCQRPLALKLLGLVLGGHTAVGPVMEARAQAQQPAAGEPAAPPAGGAGAPAPGEAPAAEGTQAPAEGAADAVPPVPDALEIGGSSAERAVLESLGERRKALQDQEGQLDLREKLLQATEERLQKRVDELKSLEQQIQQGVEEKKKQEEGEIAALVVMYENMKPKDAARIFDRLDLDVLLKVVRQMKPRKMADILARMSPEAAEKLTVAIAGGDANQPQGASVQAPAALPKIGSN